MATINHKKYDEATETFKDFYVYDGKETLIFKIDGESGKVGIGTASPASRLVVVSDDPSQVSVEASTGDVNSQINLKPSGTGIAYIKNQINTDFAFGTNNTERMRITSAGNVGIGTSSPVEILHILGNQRISAVSGYSQPAILDLHGNNSNTYGGSNVSRSRIASYTEGGPYNASMRFYTNDSANALQERMRIDGTGNVGIGTASPNMPLELVGSTANLFGNVYGTSRFLQDKTDYRGLFLGYETSGQNAVIAAESAGGISNLAFYTYNGSSWGERARVTSNGLTFNGDTAAANALDDYEEGTWTMGVSFGGGTTGITYGSTSGTYTKIGRQVTVNGYLLLTNKGTATGNARLTGLPFTLGGANGNLAAASLYFENINFANQFMGFAVVGTTTCALYEITEAGSYTVLEDTNFSNNSALIITLTYFV